jgi:NAD-dependent dihydropyrimidine dehydrogenase PreA subunit
MGYEVTVFESSAEIGGSLLKEVSEKRLPGDLLDTHITVLQGMGISFVDSRTLSGDLSIDDLRDQRYRAILLATGFSSSLPGEVSAEDKNGLDVDPETLQTNMKGVFACGALLSEKMSLVAVIASARKAAESMDRFLRKADLHAGQEHGIKRVKRFPRDGITPQSRFDPDEGLDEATAPKEAHRCMSCGGRAQVAHPEDCMTCFECEVKCPSKAITVHPFKEVLPMTLAIE